MSKRCGTFTILVLVATFVGCQAASELTESGGKQHYRHNGLHFALDVPAGWAVVPLQGNVVVELRGPQVGERGRPVAEVFARREAATVHLADDAAGLLELMKEESRYQPLTAAGAPPAPPTVESITLAGRPAKLVRRTLREGPVDLQQEMLLVAEGRQVWALVLTRPVAAEAASAAAWAELRNSFEVW